MSIMKCLKVYFKFYLVHFTFLQGKCWSFYGIAHKNSGPVPQGLRVLGQPPLLAPKNYGVPLLNIFP